MNNTFEFTGFLTTGKETEKFKPYTSTTSEKGYTMTIFQPTIVAGCNRHFTRLKGLFKADGTGKVFTLGKSGEDKDTGEKIKGEKLQFDWKDRLKPEVVEQVAEFKKFVIDLEEPGVRYKLEKALEKVKDGTITEEELKELGIVANEIEATLAKSKKKRLEYIHETDFIAFVKKLIDSGKFSKRMFKIPGNIEYTEYQGKFRENLAPTRIYLAEKDAKASSMGSIEIFFTENAVSTCTEGYLINGFIRNYDQDKKEEIAAPIQLWIDTTKDDGKMKKTHDILVKQFTVSDGNWKQLGVKVEMLNGSQKLEITDEMLNDFQKEMIELGAMTLDDVRADLGGDVYGDSVKKMVIEGISRGYTKGRKDTLYTNKDFEVKSVEIKDAEDKKEEGSLPDSSETNTENDSDDIFAGIL